MSETAPETQPQEPAAAAPTPPAEPPKPTEPPKAPEAEPKGNVWDDPDSAKAEIERLRKENAKDRTNAKAQAAADAQKELAQTIGKALGLVEEETSDPAKLTESLSASQAEAKQARVELAVFKASPAAGGDPAALLDSSSFLKSLEGIDHSDGEAIKSAIESAVEANPRLAAVTEPRKPAPNPAQGTSSGGGTLGLDAQIAEAEKAGNWRLSSQLKAQRLLDTKAGD